MGVTTLPGDRVRAPVYRYIKARPLFRWGGWRPTVKYSWEQRFARVCRWSFAAILGDSGLLAYAAGPLRQVRQDRASVSTFTTY